MAMRLRLNELNREEVRELAPRATVVLPVASTEQHGPHLPLMTDSVLGETIAMGAAKRASSDIPVVVAPTLTYGNSQHHLVFCAISLRSSTLLAVLNDLADSLVSAGFRRIFIVNSHGGNDECVKLLCKDLILRHDVAIAANSYWQTAESDLKAMMEDKLTRFPGHSGWFETSLMMAVAPELIDVARFPTTASDLPSIGHRGLARGMMVQKAGEWKRIGGYTDAPTGADPELGKKMLDAIIQVEADAMVAFHRASFD